MAASEAGEELYALAKKAEIPATYTMMAAGVLSYGDPLNLGLLGMHGCRTTNRAVNEADLVLAIGTRFSDRVALNTEKFAKNAAILQIDIDPSEVNKNVEVDYSLVGDVKQILQALLPLVKDAKHTEWMTQIQAWQAQDYRPKDDKYCIRPHQLIGKMCELAGPDALYVTDVGQHQMWATQYIRHVKPRSFTDERRPGDHGLWLRRGHRRKAGGGRKPSRSSTLRATVLSIWNLNEACTAVSYELPVITVISTIRCWVWCASGRRRFTASGIPVRTRTAKQIM